MTRPLHSNCGQSAVTLLGLLIALGLFVAILCGLIYVGAKLLDAGRTIEARHAAALTNEIDKLSLVRDRHDPVLDRLYQLATQEPALAPAAEEMTDAQFLAWADGIDLWAVLRRESLNDPWRDTGNRLRANASELGPFLRELCRDEAVYASVGATKDGKVHAMAFYSWCRTNEVPVEPPDK